MEDLSEFAGMFPRKLSYREIELLNAVLPETKPGYKKYRDRIKNFSVIGLGKFGKTNMILGDKDHLPDPDSFSAPVFAAGTVICREAEFDIIINTEAGNEIEVDISPKFKEGIPGETLISQDLNIISAWSYSDWNPGAKAPGDGSEVREIILKPGEYIIAVAPARKKIWLYEFSSGVNFLIPVTNFYNELMMIKNIRDISIVSNHNLFFNNLKNYSDKEIISAFILYNKYFHRFNINFSSASSGKIKQEDKMKSQNYLSKILRRGSN